MLFVVGFIFLVFIGDTPLGWFGGWFLVSAGLIAIAAKER